MIYITHIRLSAGGTTLQHITHVRWYDSSKREDGHCTKEEMIAWLSRAGNEAYVEDARGSVKVEIVRANPPYLRTEPNNRTTDNLLSLPRF